MRYYNIYKQQLKLSFLAPTGYGKTTAAEVIGQLYKAVNLKLAAPLYDMQESFYAILGVETRGKQDGELLQFLGQKIQRDYPYFLADDFYRRLKETSSVQIVTNDDCRPHNYKFLKEMGFNFVKIEGFFREREDLHQINKLNEIEWSSSIPCNYVISNFGTLSEYRKNIVDMMNRILYEVESLT